MAVYIDNVMLRVLNTRFPHRYFENKRIALIGEKHTGFSKGTMAWKMATKLSFIDRDKIHVFTHEKPFRFEDAEHFDLLVSVRSCEAEEMILKAAAHFKKNFALMPCECKNRPYGEKVLRYIREHPVIMGVEYFPGQYTDKVYDCNAWIVFYNIFKEERYA